MQLNLPKRGDEKEKIDVGRTGMISSESKGPIAVQEHLPVY